MPIIHSAIKKLKQDKHRQRENYKTIEAMKKALRQARTTTTTKTLSQAYSAIDTAVKKKVIHKNKAARLKSRLIRSNSKVKTQKSKTQVKSEK